MGGSTLVDTCGDEVDDVSARVGHGCSFGLDWRASGDIWRRMLASDSCIHKVWRESTVNMDIRGEWRPDLISFKGKRSTYHRDGLA